VISPRCLQHQTSRPNDRNLAGLIKNLRGIARNKKIDTLAAGGTADHVHLLLRIPPVRQLPSAGLLPV
jgi:REP element-mobilizing transposase RayT